jgi:hypothetical protein
LEDRATSIPSSVLAREEAEASHPERLHALGPLDLRGAGRAAIILRALWVIWSKAA